MSDAVAKVRDSIVVEAAEGGAVWRVRLATPKANILDLDKVTRLTEVAIRARSDRHLKVILLEAEGPNFSFGASVEEHLPGVVERMIPTFHNLFRHLLDASVMTMAAVRGQCLGGALELVSFTNRVVASHDAKLGQPEILLGVFAPVASVFLHERIGRARAEDLCLTGRTIAAAEAHEIGLIDALAADPAAAALSYAREHVLRHSASSLRFAQRALRRGLNDRFLADLAKVEALYLTDLMRTADAKEGLQAFLEKRPAKWSDA